MTALGQARRFRDVRFTSGLPPTADISGTGWHFAFGPRGDVAWSSNDLVVRNIESEPLAARRVCQKSADVWSGQRRYKPQTHM